jgi:hypothetical protein
MPFIRESVVTTLNSDGTAHIAPLGVIEEPPFLVLAPFQPSTTLENLRRHPAACINYVTDVRVFAGCISGRQCHWPVRPAERIRGHRLEAALAHAEVEVAELVDDAQRPRFRCREVHEAIHAPFRGLNRAQAAVVEAAILVSRLHFLPAEKIDREIAYLEIAVDKAAGPDEREAWGWLMEAIARHRRNDQGASSMPS